MSMSGLESETCSLTYQHNVSDFLEKKVLFCNATWDMVLCWPPILASTNVSLPCPAAIKGVDPTKYVIKVCSENGTWKGKTDLDTRPQGWTNYTPCFTPEISKLIHQLNAGSEDDAEMKLSIAAGTRVLEFIGLTTSLVTLLISLFIFSYFRSLKNNRTKIHQNLFVAMVIQVFIRLTLYIDQAVIRGRLRESETSEADSRTGIDNTPYLCEASYILMEYARTAMFMWMFIEGMYLHNRITVTVFQHKFYYSVHRLVGWGIPVVMTAAWASVTATHYNARCWWGYNFTGYFWILEGPRLAILTLNMVFLLNIIRVLVTKLRESNSSEIVQVRKAVKGTIVLLPLFGITTLLKMIATPLGKTALEFGLWSYGTHFLTSFQGFFVALLYCFLNGEVRSAIAKFVHNYFLNRTAGVRRDSALSYSVFLSTFYEDSQSSRRRSLCACLSAQDQEPRRRWPL